MTVQAGLRLREQVAQLLDNGTSRRLLEDSVTEAVQHARRKASLLRRVDSSLYMTALEVRGIHSVFDSTAGPVSEAGARHHRTPQLPLRHCTRHGACLNVMQQIEEGLSKLPSSTYYSPDNPDRDEVGQPCPVSPEAQL